jgi:hypothetical protein
VLFAVIALVVGAGAIGLVTRLRARATDTAAIQVHASMGG